MLAGKALEAGSIAIVRLTAIVLEDAMFTALAINFAMGKRISILCNKLAIYRQFYV